MDSEKENISKDSDDCQVRMLRAAEKLFAEKGFAGTSVRDITKAGNCNVAAVNYHFGGKENLYIEVFRIHLAKMREVRIKSIIDSADQSRGAVSLERLIRGFSIAFIESLTHSTDGTLFCDLMTREMLDPHLPQNMFSEDYVHPIQVSFLEVLRQIYPNLKPEISMRCVFSLVGQLRHLVMAKSLLSNGNEENSLFPDMSNVIDHIVRFSVAGFESAIANE